MTRPGKEQSVNAEGHLKEASFSGDATEEKVAENLDREKGVQDPIEERAKHSVFDEPAIFPHREPVLIERDWYCRGCGYNLRGLMTGHPCPECGQVERYEPPREGEETYAGYLATRERAYRRGRGWITAFLAPLVGLPLGLLGALVLVEQAGFLYFAVIGPAIVEIGKIAVCAALLERGRYAVHGPGQIYVATVGTALVFAVVHNLAGLSWHYAGSPVELVAWRWTVGVAMNLLCTLIAAAGLAGAWAYSRQHSQPVALARAHRLIGEFFTSCAFGATSPSTRSFWLSAIRAFSSSSIRFPAAIAVSRAVSQSISPR